MKVTAIKKFGKHQPGVPFEFPDRAAKVFIKAGKLRAAEEPAPEPAAPPKPRRGRAAKEVAADPLPDVAEDNEPDASAREDETF